MNYSVLTRACLLCGMNLLYCHGNHLRRIAAELSYCHGNCLVQLICDYCTVTTRKCRCNFVLSRRIIARSYLEKTIGDLNIPLSLPINYIISIYPNWLSIYPFSIPLDVSAYSKPIYWLNKLLFLVELVSHVLYSKTGKLLLKKNLQLS